jgi:RNA polymerase sigma-70 factor (ECF subfamily)
VTTVPGVLHAPLPTIPARVAPADPAPLDPAASDAAVLAAIGRRDEAAVAALYDCYGARAYALAYRILRDRGAAEDVVQDVYLGIWRRAESYRPGKGSVRTWLLASVHHRAIDRLRGTAGRARCDVPLDATPPAAAGDDPWREVEATLQREAIRRGLAGLPGEQRRALELAYYGGHTQTEIAAITGVPVGTVKGRLRLGLLKLRAALADPRRGPASPGGGHHG